MLKKDFLKGKELSVVRETWFRQHRTPFHRRRRVAASEKTSELERHRRRNNLTLSLLKGWAGKENKVATQFEGETVLWGSLPYGGVYRGKGGEIRSV